MALTYSVPGVYVEEGESGARVISALSTSTAAFIGKAPNPVRMDEPVAITNWSQFVRIFVSEDSKNTHLVNAVFGFFNNGGSRCYVVNIGDRNTVAGDERKKTGVNALEQVEDVAIIAAPGFCDAASYDALIGHCEKMRDRFAILDAPEQVDDIDKLKTVIQAAAAPAAGGEGEGGTGGGTSRTRKPTGGFLSPQSSYAAYYFPWIMVKDPFSAEGATVNSPVCGHVAGVYARTDFKFGVHKAPANEPIRGALRLLANVTRNDQGDLNEKGVNCIRYFPDAGIRIWGARTRSDDPQWRYINVRRLFLMIMKSIERGTSWTVFEPNDERTWKSIERDIRAFLTLLWRDGALKGTTVDQAFFVKCDAETNPKEVIDAGRLITEIGIAPVKPAEFVIFRISQYEGRQEAQTAVE